LHFAADHGLILSAVELLKLPFSIDACLTVNIDDETPLQIANRHNFHLPRTINKWIIYMVIDFLLFLMVARDELI
jgi:hypothetical protein